MIRFCSLFLVFSFISTNLSFCQNIDKAYIDSLFLIKKDIEKIIADKDIDQFTSQIFKIPINKGIQTYQYIDSTFRYSDYISINILSEYASLVHRTGKTKTSRDLNLKGLNLSKKYNNQTFLFRYNQLLSYHYIDRAMADSASFYINEAEKAIFSNSKELSNSWPVVFNRKADVEALLGNYEKRDYYYDEMIRSIDTIPNHPRTVFLLSQVTYHYKVTKNYEKHAYYANKLRQYYFKKNDFKMPKLHTSIASILSFEDSKNYIEELNKILANPALDKTSNTYDIISTALAQALINDGNYKDVIELLSERTYDNSIKMSPYDRVLNLNNLENAYEKLGDYKNAFNTLNIRKSIQDSIRRKDMMNKVADYEVKYETERKESELKVVSLENQKNKQQKQLYSFIAIGGISACAFIGFLLYKNSRKKAQLEKQKQLLETTLDEKNILLKEIHHRVKNSFQIVSSLLYLQSENIEDKEAQLAIKEAENRVRSMVLIHQKLYSKNDLVGINTKEYIEDLTKDIVESHQFKKEPIVYELNIEPKVLDIETITPLGLIINELITNVIKHAFNDIDKSSRMAIEFKQEDNELVLKVSDNGIGMPSQVKESSFGIKLIKALSKKLKAQLDFLNTKQGTTAQLRIKRFNVMT